MSLDTQQTAPVARRCGKALVKLAHLLWLLQTSSGQGLSALITFLCHFVPKWGTQCCTVISLSLSLSPLSTVDMPTEKECKKFFQSNIYFLFMLLPTVMNLHLDNCFQSTNFMHFCIHCLKKKNPDVVKWRRAQRSQGSEWGAPFVLIFFFWFVILIFKYLCLFLYIFLQLHS